MGRGWLAAASLALVLPKCVLCLLAYAGASAAVAGGAAVEWCGGETTTASAWPALAAWLGGAGLALAAWLSIAPRR